MKLFAILLTSLALQGGGTGSIYHDGWTDFNKNGQKDVYEDSSQPLDARVEDLLSQMTLEEKTCQLVTLYGCGRVLKDAQPTSGWSDEIWKDGCSFGVDATVTNTGSRSGDEIIQLYIRDKVSSVVTCDSVLRGFERVSLSPGESCAVHFDIVPEDLQILDRKMEWVVEPGEFEIMLGASSTDIRLRETVTVEVADVESASMAAVGDCK